MRILAVLTYYAPHISGLTVYAQRLYRRLIASGHEVTVLTSRYDSDLPKTEELDGVKVIRSSVLMQVSKGALMPLFPWQAAKLVASHDLVHIHLPQLEASWPAFVGKLLRKPVVMTYHCDIELPNGPPRYVFTPAIRVSHYLSGKFADRIVVNAEEFGKRARLPRHFNAKVSCVYPPIELEDASLSGLELRRRHGLGDGPLVGFVGRFAEEKGIPSLIRSVPLVEEAVPGVRYVLAGPTDQVLGERVYEQVRQDMERLGSRLTHVGILSDAELAAFFDMIDVLVLPSVNSTESFGMTQAEAMLMGTPVVATDLPGVRETVRVTGMGELVPPGDDVALARAITAVIKEPERYVRPADEIRELFSSRRTAEYYERLFSELLGVEQQLTHTVAPVRDAKAPRAPRTQ